MQLLSQLQETSDHDALPNGDGDHLGCRDDGDLDHLDIDVGGNEDDAIPNREHDHHDHHASDVGEVYDKIVLGRLRYNQDVESDSFPLRSSLTNWM